MEDNPVDYVRSLDILTKSQQEKIIKLYRDSDCKAYNSAYGE